MDLKSTSISPKKTKDYKHKNHSRTYNQKNATKDFLKHESLDTLSSAKESQIQDQNFDTTDSKPMLENEVTTGIEDTHVNNIGKTNCKNNISIYYH